MPNPPRFTIKGERELIAKLKRLGDRKLVRKVIRKATTAAAQVLVKNVRAKWESDSGLSKKSVAKKVFKTRAGFGAVVGVDKEAKDEHHAPSNVDHLAEFGFTHVGGTVVPAVAPLRRGFEAGIGAALARYEEKAAAEIEKEAMKR